MSGFNRLDTQDNRLILLEMAIKCGDMNNPTKNPEIAGKWIDCVMEEFYRQGDAERTLGFPISQFMDRETPNVPKCQVRLPSYSQKYSVCLLQFHRLDLLIF
jgi:hypothetical protein